MNDGVTSYLFTQGVLGIACIVLGVVCVKLYNKTERQQIRIEQLQDLRLTDSKEVTKDVTDVMATNTTSNRILAEKIEVVQGKRQS